ncbi:MAG: peptide deformylase [Clostridiales bacterium]|jgi:peptide deformylase|nr:peptide deformylase [Clostridiales bacterium]
MKSSYGDGDVVKEILLLGDKRLYERSNEVNIGEMDFISNMVLDLHDTLLAFRKRFGCGRAIAAPQIGVFKRVIYMNIEEPHENSGSVTFINPVMEFPNNEKITILDDCMSFPGLFVNVERYEECIIHYKDIEWNDCVMKVKDDIAELLQHEYDHLDGILATMRAMDNKSFVMRKLGF